VYRRRYGTDLPDAAVPSRFLAEIPAELMEDLGLPRASRAGARTSSLERFHEVDADGGSKAYAYEDEDQSLTWRAPYQGGGRPQRSVPLRTYNSAENIAEFFASRGKKINLIKLPIKEPTGATGFRPGQRVKHPKYGEGTVHRREGEGDHAKITVQFPRFGLKKLVEKYAQLERA